MNHFYDCIVSRMWSPGFSWLQTNCTASQNLVGLFPMMNWHDQWRAWRWQLYGLLPVLIGCRINSTWWIQQTWCYRFGSVRMAFRVVVSFVYRWSKLTNSWRIVTLWLFQSITAASLCYLETSTCMKTAWHCWDSRSPISKQIVNTFNPYSWSSSSRILSQTLIV